jgi:hypothetical protein
MSSCAVKMICTEWDWLNIAGDAVRMRLRIPQVPELFQG